MLRSIRRATSFGLAHGEIGRSERVNPAGRRYRHALRNLEPYLRRWRVAARDPARPLRAAGAPRAHGRPLAPTVDVSAYRTVQEALTNTLKHSGASRADVHLRYRR